MDFRHLDFCTLHLWITDVETLSLKVNIACALRWGVASIGITLLGVAHPIQEKHFRCGTCVGGRLSSGVARV